MMRIWLSGIGISAAGVSDWENARSIVCGTREFEAAEYSYRAPELLSGAERRRCPASVKLALDVAEQARIMSGLEGGDMAGVFASMTGDGPIVTRSLATLADNPHYLSPTDFHNSVHNAAVGYWAIASGSRHGATSLTAAEESFAAALLKAAMQVLSGNVPVMLCAYEVPFLAPLDVKAGIRVPFGAALVLHGEPPAASLAKLDIALEEGGTAPSRPLRDFWSGLFDTNPAARIIPIAEQIALMEPGEMSVVKVGTVGSSMLTVTLAR
ncbi:MAG: beta-ketoacyl synthase chain length factor [Pseudomonadota bacterium]